MSDWSKRRRLEAAIAGEQVDRVPVALWRHWPGDDQDAEALTAVHMQWQRDYDWDFMKVGPSSSYTVAGWGLRDKWVGNIEGTRDYVFRPIQKPSDWEKLTVLDPHKGQLATQLKTLQLVSEQIDPSVPFIATLFSPLSQAKYMATDKILLSHIRSHPDLVRHGLEVITESTIRFIEEAKKTGIDGIYYAVQHARFPIMSPSEFAAWGKPFDLQILRTVQDLWLNILHMHSDGINLAATADYPVSVVNWHDRETGVTLHDGLEVIQGAASGGIDQWTLHQESPENMLLEAADALEQTGGRRLILGTGCVAMTSTPLRNIRALREFVE